MRISGKNGALYMGIASSGAAAEPIAFIKQLDIQATTAKYDGTSMGDANMIYVTGLPDAQGKFTGFYDNATAQTYTAAQDCNSRRCYLYPDAVNNAGTYWYGTGYFDFEVTVPVDGPATIQGTMVPATAFTKVG